jgi:15-cis-phytoene synthase
MSTAGIYTFQHARALTRRYARTFYFASHALPAAKRDAAYAVYAFCRIADNATDIHREDTEQIPDAARQIDRLRSELADVYADGDVPTRWIALRETVRRYRIPREYFVELLNGVEMDLTPRRFVTFADLEVYCYRVASVVGLIMTHIFGASSPEALRRAAQLGTAMQLTNILRDIGEDHRMGRIYLPQDELRTFGITEEMIGTGQVAPAIVPFLRFQIDRARTLYAEAERGIPLIPDDGSRFSTRMMSALYARILDAIEENAYDVFSRRAHVPLQTKLRLAGRIMRQSLMDRLRPGAIRDDGGGLHQSSLPDHPHRRIRGQQHTIPENFT